MRNLLFSVMCICLIVGIVGCGSMGENTARGSVMGGLIGAGTGAIIGHQSGHTGEGAAIGAAAGALGGGLIGNSIDNKTNPNQLAVTSIVSMAQQGVPDDVIIDEIKRTRSVYNVTAEVMEYLKNNGVSNAVINAMINTAQ